jgi:hypothetical protein
MEMNMPHFLAFAAEIGFLQFQEQVSFKFKSNQQNNVK